MTLQKFDFEGAGPSGTALTPGNTGLTRVTVNTNSAVSSNAWSHLGSLSALLSAPNAAQVFLGYDWTAAVSVAVRAYFDLVALPSTATAAMRLATADAGTFLGAFNISANGSWSITDPASTVAFGAPAGDLVAGNQYRLEYYWKAGAGSGEARAAVYLAGDGSTVRDSGLLTSQANGAANVGSCRVGKGSTSGTWASFRIDDLAVQDGATGLIGEELPTGPQGIWTYQQRQQIG